MLWSVDVLAMFQAYVLKSLKKADVFGTSVDVLVMFQSSIRLKIIIKKSRGLRNKRDVPTSKRANGGRDAA